LNRQRFPGFPARSSLTPLPGLFFSKLLPETSSLSELKVMLHIFWRLGQKTGLTKFITYDELASDKVLLDGLDETGDRPQTLREALESAVDRGVLLHVTWNGEGQSHDVYFVNSEAGRKAMAKVEAGELSFKPSSQGKLSAEEGRPNIFVLYEQHIGLLNPSVAEELKEAEELYPASWIEEAFQEAASLNKRSWRYISRILERWSAEGKDSGESGRDSKKKRSPNRYLKGKYGYLVRR
jgi:DNA replication protein